jgi:hypothetical protein
MDPICDGFEEHLSLPAPRAVKTRPEKAVAAVREPPAWRSCAAALGHPAHWESSGRPSLDTLSLELLAMRPRCFDTQDLETEYAVSPNTPLLSTEVQENVWVCGESCVLRQCVVRALRAQLSLHPFPGSRGHWPIARGGGCIMSLCTL